MNLSMRSLVKGDVASMTTGCALGAWVIALSAGISDGAADAMAAEEPVQPGFPAMLIDTQLNLRSARVLSLTESRIEFIDELGRRRQTGLRELLALVTSAEEPTWMPALVIMSAARPGAPRITSGVIDLTDGQRYPGDLSSEPPADESLVWSHRTFGRLDFPIERVLRFQRPGTARADRAPASAASDTLRLINGDVLRGFIEALSDPTRIEVDNQPIELPMSRIAGAEFSNTSVRPTGIHVWLSDGTVAAVERITIDTDRRATLHLELGPSESAEWSYVRAVAFDAGRLLPLASVPPLSQEPSAGRRWTSSVTYEIPPGPGPGSGSGPGETIAMEVAALNAPDITVPGPMRVSWELPQGARRVAGSAALDAGTAPWGDCEIVILAGEREVLRKELTQESGPIAFNIELAGARTFTIATEPGRYGPILDRVVLSRPLVLMGPKGE